MLKKKDLQLPCIAFSILCRLGIYPVTFDSRRVEMKELPKGKKGDRRRLFFKMWRFFAISHLLFVTFRTIGYVLFSMKKNEDVAKSVQRKTEQLYVMLILSVSLTVINVGIHSIFVWWPLLNIKLFNEYSRHLKIMSFFSSFSPNQKKTRDKDKDKANDNGKKHIKDDKGRIMWKINKVQNVVQNVVQNTLTLETIEKSRVSVWRQVKSILERKTLQEMTIKFFPIALLPLFGVFPMLNYLIPDMPILLISLFRHQRQRPHLLLCGFCMFLESLSILIACAYSQFVVYSTLNFLVDFARQSSAQITNIRYKSKERTIFK